jgi:hypothetical protein
MQRSAILSAVGSPGYTATAQTATAVELPDGSTAHSGIERASRLQMHISRREYARFPPDNSAGKLH